MKAIVTSMFLAVALLPVPTAVAAGSKEYVCDFKNFHSMDEPMISKSVGFVLQFSYDTVTNDAFIKGNNGLSPVNLIKGSEGISFIEVLSTGAVQSTTITSDGFAVHSRHTMILGSLVPSQYYGACE